MYIFSTFKHSMLLELAITELEEKGIKKEDILTVPLIKQIENKNTFQLISMQDGITNLDIAAALGTAFMVLGIIYGFELYGGPIIWGITGLFLGGLIGYMLDFLRFQTKKNKEKDTDVIVMVSCSRDKADMVEKVFWDNQTLGVARLDR